MSYVRDAILLSLCFGMLTGYTELNLIRIKKVMKNHCGLYLLPENTGESGVSGVRSASGTSLTLWLPPIKVTGQGRAVTNDDYY